MDETKRNDKRMNRFSSHASIWLIIVVFAFLQFGWHWYAARDSDLARQLLSAYIARSAVSGKGASGYFDVVFPAILSGLSVGLLSKQLQSRFLVLYVVLLSVVLVIALSVGAAALPKGLLWWWPHSGPDRALFYTRMFLETVLIAAVFAYGGRLHAIRT